MYDFTIQLSSLAQVHEFVHIATSQPFEISVADYTSVVNAKSFMSMFTLNFTMPLHVRMQCDKVQYEGFTQAVERYMVASKA